MAKRPTKEQFLKTFGFDPNSQECLWSSNKFYDPNSLLWETGTREPQRYFWNDSLFWNPDVSLWETYTFMHTRFGIESNASTAIAAKVDLDTVHIDISTQAKLHLWAKTFNEIKVNLDTVSEITIPPSKISFWGGQYQQLIYQTALLIPAEMVGVKLFVYPEFESGRLLSLEYGTAKEPKKFWQNNRFWSDSQYTFWGRSFRAEVFYPMPNYIVLQEPQFIFFRIKANVNEYAVLKNIKYVFDVDDKVKTYSDIFVGSEGTRLPVGEREFVKITNIIGNVEYSESLNSAKVLTFVDRGIIENGFVVKGPLIRLLDREGNPTSGIADVTMKGYGINN